MLLALASSEFFLLSMEFTEGVLLTRVLTRRCSTYAFTTFTLLFLAFTLRLYTYTYKMQHDTDFLTLFNGMTHGRPSRF